MNISTDLKHISPTSDKARGGYEWWYFDAISENEKYSIVIIFYQCNPFSTNYIKDLPKKNEKGDFYPAISVSLYAHGKPVYYSFLEYEEDQFSWDQESRRMRIGDDQLQITEQGGNIEVKIYLNQKLASGHSIKAQLNFKSPVTRSNLIGEHSDELHHWNLIQPKAKVSGGISLNGKKGKRKIQFKGTGYHDHNTGFEPMKDSFEDWYWGRYHFREFTLIYYLMNRQDEQQFQGWLINPYNQQVVDSYTSAELKDYSFNIFGLMSAKKITLVSKKSEVTVQTPKKADNGPFYQRFLGEAVVKRGDLVVAAKGLSEYIRPERIYTEKFWPLVHMRLRYMHEEPHWVQKSKFLYPWTW